MIAATSIGLQIDSFSSRGALARESDLDLEMEYMTAYVYIYIYSIDMFSRKIHIYAASFAASKPLDRKNAAPLPEPSSMVED